MIKIASILRNVQALMNKPEDKDLIETIDSDIRSVLFDLLSDCRQGQGLHNNLRAGCIREMACLADTLYIAYRFSRSMKLARVLIHFFEGYLNLLMNLNNVTIKALLLPKVLSKREQRRASLNAAKLEILLQKNEVDPKLIRLLLIPFRRFLANLECRYSDFAYAQAHFIALKQLDLAAFNQEEMSRRILQTMLGLDFNNLQYIDYCIAGYREVLDGYGDDSSAKRRFIDIQKRKIKNAACSRNRCYDYGFISLKKHLLIWLSEEKAQLPAMSSRLVSQLV